MHIDLFDDNPSTVLSKKEKEKVKDLERVICHLRKLHGNGEPCLHPDDDHVVSDLEFDDYVKQLEKLDPSSLVLKGAMSAADFDPNAKKVKHDPPMTSIKKANGSVEEKESELDKFIAAYAKEFGISESDAKKGLVVSYKHDGVACSLVYQDGKLIQAGLRPKDGVWGEDVTANVQYIKDIPQELPVKVSCIIRGELECKISTFNRLRATITRDDGSEFANPRNYTTGSIRQFKTPVKTKERELSFIAYSILNLDNAPYKTERERAIWCNKVLKIPFVRTEFLTETLLKELEDRVPELDYEVDGAVLSIDNLDHQEQMGVHGSAENAIPKGKLAWKFADETAEPKITNIAWYTGRTGQIVPVCEFNGVKLAGTIVQRAAAHSLGFLVRNNIHIGNKIRIRKSGKIIPQVIGKIDNGAFIPTVDGGDPSLPQNFDLSKFTYPKECPSCGTPTKVVEGQKHGLLDLNCENEACPARNIKTFVNYLEKFGVKGVGEATVTRWVEANLITKFSDFYTLSIKDLLAKGETLRQSLLAIASIHMVTNPEQITDNQQLAMTIVDAMKRKKKITLAKFVSCLGIPGASRGTGTALSTHFKSLDDILEASEEDFVNVEDIGEKTAKTLYDYLVKHKADILELEKDHLYIELPKQGKFSGKTFVFTGSPGPEGKDYFKDIVEQEGGIVKTSVSKKIDYVIIGTDSGSKGEKAKELASQGHAINIVEGRDNIIKLFN